MLCGSIPVSHARQLMGGIVAMANWTKEGFVGTMFQRPSRDPSCHPTCRPLLSGDEGVVRERFGAGVADLRLTRVLYRFDYRFGPADVVEFFRNTTAQRPVPSRRSGKPNKRRFAPSWCSCGALTTPRPWGDVRRWKTSSSNSSRRAHDNTLSAEDSPRGLVQCRMDVLRSGATMKASLRAILGWIERYGERTAGSTILAEAMVKATRHPSFRRWTARASQRFRAAIRERLEAARDAGELDPKLDLTAAAVLEAMLKSSRRPRARR
jgi:hypothetical protein